MLYCQMVKNFDGYIQAFDTAQCDRQTDGRAMVHNHSSIIVLMRFKIASRGKKIQLIEVQLENKNQGSELSWT